MDSFRIVGGKKLSGTIEVKSAKNAVLPCMAVALLTSEMVTLKNISLLSDTQTLAQLLRSMGMSVSFIGDTVQLQADHISSTEALYEYVSKMRASFWVLGPLLARFGQARVSLPGGCAIGPRPVNFYLMALEKMGAKIKIDGGYVIAKGPLKAADIVFERKSVGATHNTIMAAVLTKGTTHIYNPAQEPEVQDLIALLNQMGADITGAGTDCLTIHGVDSLHGTTFTPCSDRIETAGYIVAAALTESSFFIKGGDLNLLPTVREFFKLQRIYMEQRPDGLFVDGTHCHLVGSNITTCEYPGFATDVQPIVCPLLAVCNGESLVSEHIYENRFMHVAEMQRMNVDVNMLNANNVLFKGGAKLRGAEVMASDLRGGMALVLCGLAAQGETFVRRIYHIDRGYYALENKLRGLGADITRISDAG